MNSNFLINILNDNQIPFENGLNEQEILFAENFYNITFPTSLKNFLRIIHPISNGFYNWRDFSEKNTKTIKYNIQLPFFEFEKWIKRKGEYKNDFLPNDICDEFKNAPPLIPIYNHRYIPSGKYNDPPIFSIIGTDIICYGSNFENWLNNEFKIFKPIKENFSKSEAVAFWSKILDY